MEDTAQRENVRSEKGLQPNAEMSNIQKADTKTNKRECEGLAKETVCYEEYFAEGFLVPKYASYVKDMSLDKLHH